MQLNILQLPVNRAYAQVTAESPSGAMVAYSCASKHFMLNDTNAVQRQEPIVYNLTASAL